MIPTGTVELGHHDKDFVWHWVWHIIKKYHPHVGSTFYQATDTQVREKFYYMLNSHKKTLINFGHAHPEFEHTLALVLEEYYLTLVPLRCMGITPATFNDKGFWRFIKEERLVMLMPVNLPRPQVDCGVSQDELDAADDWHIDFADSVEASLVSAERGYSKKVLKIFEQAHVRVPPLRDMLPAKPDAVPQAIRDIEVPAFLLEQRPARPQAKGKAKAKAVQTPQKAPRRLRRARQADE